MVSALLVFPSDALGRKSIHFGTHEIGRNNFSEDDICAKRVVHQRLLRENRQIHFMVRSAYCTLYRQINGSGCTIGHNKRFVRIKDLIRCKTSGNIVDIIPSRSYERSQSHPRKKWGSYVSVARIPKVNKIGRTCITCGETVCLDLGFLLPRIPPTVTAGTISTE